MIGNQKDNGKYVVIATKTSPAFARLFSSICEKKGIKPYLAMQMMVDTFVRYTDDMHNLSPDMEKIMAVFEHMTGWDEAFNLADAKTARHIDEAVYFLTADGKHGSRAVMVQRPFMGEPRETYNIQQILERVIEALMPERYRRLRALAVDMECGSILELLDVMIDSHTIEQINQEFRKDFEDCNRHDYGKPVEYGQRTRRKHHKGVDMYDRQQPIRFVDADRETANDVVDALGCKPFDVEP